MRTSIVTATFLVVVVGATATDVGAADNLALKGSDTLEDLTKQILAACPGASGAGITYVGGGSTSGEEALRTAAQSVAPMSRFLQSARTCTFAGGPADKAEGLVVALDGLAVTGAQSTAGGCGIAFSGAGASKSIAVTDQNGVAGVQCPGCSGGSYVIAADDYRDILKVVYTGIHHDGTKDCNSDVRHSLVNSWGNLFETACGSGACTQLKHAWRRADLSGTTDTFLALLGLPAIGTNPFCNGAGVTLAAGETADFLDNDPIRRTCDGDGTTANPGEQVCGRDGKLGLVLPVFVPENLTNAESYPTTACSPGVFRFMAGPAFPGKCPNGTTPLFGKCFTPVQLNADGSVNPACINRRNSCPIFTPAGTDCRSYNQFLRKAGDATGTLLRDANRRQLTGSFYRVHTTTALGGGATCQTGTATDQIGCLAQASSCTLGFAGREAITQPGATAISVRNIQPTIANVQNLVLTPTNPNDDYPLARKLYINTMSGFETVTGGELELARCLANNALAGPLVTATGFVQVPGGVICEDFNETQCGAASNANACSNNPAGIPQ